MQRAYGIDTSPRSALTYTHQPHQDFAAVIVSDGNSDIQGYEPLLKEAGKADVTIAIHYARSAVLADKQLDVFFQAIQGFKVDGCALDFEKSNNTKSANFASAARYMLDEMLVMAPSLLYSNRYTIQDWIYPFGMWPRNYPLWIAQYPYNEVKCGPATQLATVPTNLDWQPVLPAGITDWKIWQYSADGNRRASANGITGNTDVDRDVFNGTIKSMKEFFGVTTPELPPGINRTDVINECIKTLEEIK